MPGVHHAMAGLLAKNAGFDALYVSGNAIAGVLGMPDLGVVTLDEVCFFVRAIHRATDLPLLVDIDTGFGEVMNVMRTVRELEDAGAAAVHIEDQILPKKCGHLNDKKLATPEEMAAKIRAARRARRHLRIVARTDAITSEGIEGGIARGKLYLEAGADYVFPEAVTSEADYRRFAKEVKAPLLANMTEFGRTPFFTDQQFQEFGYKMVIWPATSFRACVHTLEDLYATIAREGSAESFLPRLQTRAQHYETVRYWDYEALDSSLAKSVLPTVPPS
jgi:methylisocitrate lyase